MPLETGNHICDLDASWPLGADPTNRGDDHLRLIKGVLKTTFPGEGGAGFCKTIEATEDEINNLVGTTGPIQDQLDSGVKTITAGEGLTGGGGPDEEGDVDIAADLTFLDQRYVRNELQVAFGAGLKDRIYLTDNVTIRAPLEANDTNIGNAWDNTTHLFIAPVGGVYQFWGFMFAESSTGNLIRTDLRMNRLDKPGVPQFFSLPVPPTTMASNGSSMAVACEAGAVFEMLVTLSGSDLTIPANGIGLQGILLFTSEDPAALSGLNVKSPKL
jgi:hypothetical protein